MAEGVPAHVKRLIDRYIVSVEQLEALLLLRRHPETQWGPEQVARELATSPESAHLRLKDLKDGGFLRAEGSSFKYEPTSRDLAKAVEDLADTYGKRRVTVIGLIFSKPPDAVRSFADAFKLKED